MLERLNRFLSAPAIVAAAAAIATASVFVLQAAVEGTKGELEKLQQQLVDGRAELDTISQLVAQGADANTAEQERAFLEAVDAYPAREDVDPLERAGETA